MLGMLSQTFAVALGQNAQHVYLQNARLDAPAAHAAGLVHQLRAGVLATQMYSRAVAMRASNSKDLVKTMCCYLYYWGQFVLILCTACIIHHQPVQCLGKYKHLTENTDELHSGGRAKYKQETQLTARPKDPQGLWSIMASYGYHGDLWGSCGLLMVDLGC